MTPYFGLQSHSGGGSPFFNHWALQTAVTIHDRGEIMLIRQAHHNHSSRMVKNSYKITKFHWHNWLSNSSMMPFEPPLAPYSLSRRLSKRPLIGQILRYRLPHKKSPKSQVFLLFTNGYTSAIIWRRARVGTLMCGKRGLNCKPFVPSAFVPHSAFRSAGGLRSVKSAEFLLQ